MSSKRIPSTAGSRPEQAVVIGGRVAGLLAARVLADRYEHVIVIDRNTADSGPSRSSVTGQVLTLQSAAQLERLWPGILGDLAAGGATIIGAGEDGADLATMQATQPFFEHHALRRMAGFENVTHMSGVDVVGLLTKGPHCVGVWVLPRRHGAAARTVWADLVVDAMGRGSRLCPWLANGWRCEVPLERSKITMRYLSRLYRLAASVAAPPTVRVTEASRPHRLVIMAVEHDRYVATFCSLADNDLALDDDQFNAVVRSQTTPEFAGLVRRGQSMELCSFTAPVFQRRRFDQAIRLPAGVIAPGGSVYSPDPLQGQELTVAAQHAAVLDRLLQEVDEASARRVHLPSRYFAAITPDFR
jgi:2-polyprenyl-6-methoxyphenol hydroxylase-like FAD-dependent oxidoreductase